MQINVKISPVPGRSPESLSIPRYATPGSAACDLCADLDQPVTILPGARILIGTGFSLEIPAGFVGLVFARSGLASKHGIMLSNSVGVIDSDYRGELKVGLLNASDTPYTISPGDRIAQLAFVPVYGAVFELCESLETTERGEGGFGSTGIGTKKGE